MNVRFKMTSKGEIAILPRKEYEALAAKVSLVEAGVEPLRFKAPAIRDQAHYWGLTPKPTVKFDWLVNGHSRRFHARPR